MKLAVDKNIKLLGLVSFLNDMGSEMMKPLIPFFLEMVGGSTISLGVIGGFQEAVATIFTILFGYLSDKFKNRKIFIFLGYITSAIFKFFLAFAQTASQVVLYSISERLGKALRTAPRDALISDINTKVKGRDFGFHRMLDAAGSIVGSIVTVILFWWLHFEIRTILIAAAVLTVCAIIPLFFVHVEKQEQKLERFSIKFNLLSRSFKKFLVVSAFFAMGNISYLFFIVRAQQFFKGQWSVIAPIQLYVLFTLFYALFSFPVGIISDYVGRKIILLGGYSLMAIVVFGFAFLTHRWLLIIFFALYGIVRAILEVGNRAYISDLSQSTTIGTALGTFFFVQGIVALVANLLAGWLSAISFEYMFVVSGIWILISIGLFVFLLFNEKVEA